MANNNLGGLGDFLGWGAGVGGLIGLTSNLGGDGGASQDYGQARGLYGNIANYAGDAARRANDAFGVVDRYNPSHYQSLDDYGSYLRQAPWTDQRDARDLSQAMGGTAQAYNRARAHLASSLAQRGLQTTDSGEASSALAGGLAGIENAYAGAEADARQQIASARINQRAGNLAKLADLYSGVVNQGYSNGMQGYQNAGALAGSAAAGFTGIGNAEAEQNQARNKGFGDLLSTGASLAKFV